MNIVREIAVTAKNLVTMPLMASFNTLYEVGNTTFGVAASALSVFSAGKSTTINKYADYTSQSSEILRPFSLAIIRLIDPKTKFVRREHNGKITEIFVAPMFSKAADAAYDEESFWQKHIVSRGAYLLGALGAIITRTVDFALGVFALGFAVLPCFGQSARINGFAVDQLGALTLIDDLCTGLRGIVNPQQFVIREYEIIS